MSDGGLGDDLFPDSPEPTTAISAAPAPVASGSRSPTRSPVLSPKQKSKSPTPSPAPVSPVKTADEDVDEDDMGLFGDEDEDEPKPAESEDEDRRRDSSATPDPNPLEYGEQEDGDAVQVEEYYNNLMLPKLPRMSATDGKVWHLKLPAYVNLDSKPYDADYYHATADDEEIDGKEQPMLAKQKILGVKNTIRWRWTTGSDGQPKQESNSRMVRWSDGSMSLQLGSDLFDVASSHGTTLARPEDIQAAGKPLAAELEAAPTSTTFLCVPSTYERVLITETSLAGQLSLVPTSGTSKTHIELVKHVGQQHVKHARMIIIDDNTEPGLKNMLLKADGRDPHKTTKPRVKRANGASSSGRRVSRRVNDYSDEEEEKEYPTRKSGPGDYSDDDGFIVADDDEDEAEETEDEDEMAWGSSKKAKSKSKSKSKKRKGSDEDEDMDSMEEADRKIEQRERERKRAKKEKKKKSRDYVDTDEDEDEDAVGEVDADGEEDMEMESEED